VKYAAREKIVRVKRGQCIVALFVWVIAGCRSEDSSRSAPASDPPRPIARAEHSLVVITMDTTRADHLEPYGFKDIKTPVLSQFAREGIVFDRAYAVAPITLPAHTSILTGLYPPQSGVRNNGTHYVPPDVTTLAERLRARSYRAAAFVSAAVLDSRYGLDQGFELYDDDLSTGRERHPRIVPDRPAEFTVAAAGKWLSELGQGERFFLWVHLYDPHAVYSPPPPFRDEYRERLYDGEIAYMDSQIGRLLDHPRIRSERPIVTILADHGESLGEHGEQTHAILTYDATMHVPWMIRLPSGPQAIRFNPPVDQTELVPTVLDLIGAEPDGSLPGRSLVPLIEGRGLTTRPLYAETYLPYYTYGWAKVRVLRRNDLKLIDAPEPELYDLQRDPRELANRLTQDQGVAHDLRRDLGEFLKSIGDAERETALQLDEAAAQQLRNLGYLAEGTVPNRPDAERPDPKKMIEVHVNLERGRHMLGDRLYKQAENVFRMVLKKDPGNISAFVDLANALDAQRRFDEASRVLDEALRRDPGYVRLHMQYARIELRRERHQEALRRSDAALAVDARSVEARIQRAVILQRLERTKEAAEVLLGALAEVPDDPRLNTAVARLVHLREKDYERARALLNKALSRDPFLVIAWQAMGEVYERTAQTTQAVEAYREGLRRAPDDPELHARLGILLARGGLPEAEAHLREAIRLDDEFHPETHVALGAWLAEHDRLTEARAEYERVLAVEPENSGALVNRAIALYRSGQADAAMADFEAVLKREPDNAELHNNYAVVAIDRGKWKQAEKHARRATELNPRLIEAWSNLGIALDEQKKPAEAARALAKAIELDPSYWQARNNLATVYRKTGRSQEAADLFLAVLQQVPNQAEVHLELGDLYGGPLKDASRAREHYNAFLRYAPRHPRAAEIRAKSTALATTDRQNGNDRAHR